MTSNTTSNMQMQSWKHSGSEAVENGAILDYDRFVAHTNTVFEELRDVRLATEEDVAKVIYQAATDGTNRLRYVATEDISAIKMLSKTWS
ncbi:hypothetical protein IFO70_33085 [Phormidium tenue FACHB-886]|nr:hypothetical protein [Phormidium tenue FACHB-886]